MYGVASPKTKISVPRAGFSLGDGKIRFVKFGLVPENLASAVGKFDCLSCYLSKYQLILYYPYLHSPDVDSMKHTGLGTEQIYEW